MFSRIMIPIDLAHTAEMEKALTVAADLSKKYGAEAHIVGVTQSVPTEIAATPEAYAGKLSDFAESCSEIYGVNFTAHSEVSHDITVDLDKVLSQSAMAINADLIVMASHVPGFTEHLFSSNAGYIASHSSISVFVVR